MIIWKGKGILILLYLMVAVMVVAIIGGLLKEYLGLSDRLPIKVFMGIALIVTGIWTKFTAEDYYIDKEGRRKYLDIENDLFFIKMKTWGLILPSIGFGLIVYGVAQSL
jgi:flagellar biosynthesis protein FliP